jgi:putative ABC transport system permease protein
LLIDTQYGNIVIEPREDEKWIETAPSIQKKIDAIPGVVGSSAQYIFGGTISYGDESGTWEVYSVDPTREMMVTNIHEMMAEGEYLTRSDSDEIVIGKEISGTHGAVFPHKSLKGVKVGERVSVAFPNGVKKEYRVKGIFDSTLFSSDLRAFITKKESESVLEIGDRASQIVIRIAEADEGKEEKYITKFKELGIGEEIKSWKSYKGFIETVIVSLNLVKNLLSGFGLLVAAITIFVVIYVNAINKRKQIGILKAVGIKEDVIMGSFVLQAFFLAVCGSIMGLLFFLFGITPYFVAHPLHFPLGNVSLSVSYHLIIMNLASLITASIIAGFIPSWMVIRGNILDAIWER